MRQIAAGDDPATLLIFVLSETETDVCGLDDWN
jgi:hypothetical protein